MSEDTQRLERIMETGFATLADLLRETNSRLDETNSRLDETNGRLDETNSRLGRLESRVDNLIEIAGGETRKLRERVDQLEVRMEAVEKKAS